MPPSLLRSLACSIAKFAAFSLDSLRRFGWMVNLSRSTRGRRANTSQLLFPMTYIHKEDHDSAVSSLP